MKRRMHVFVRAVTCRDGGLAKHRFTGHDLLAIIDKKGVRSLDIPRPHPGLRAPRGTRGTDTTKTPRQLETT